MVQALCFISRYVVQRGRCIYCGKGMIAKSRVRPSPMNQATVEHVAPLRVRKSISGHGGAIVLACRRCNEERGNHPLTPQAHILARAYSRAGDVIASQLALHLAAQGIVCVGRGHADLALQTFAQSPQWREP